MDRVWPLNERREPGRRANSTVLVLTTMTLLLSGCSSSDTGEPVVIDNTAVPPLPTLNPAKVAQGAEVYAAHCATCHGSNLEGAPEWKKAFPDGSYPPPPHDGSGHTWHHADALLLEIIADGGDPAYNSKMPAFKDKLTESEREAVVDFIKSRWGQEEREFQWWITAREK